MKIPVSLWELPGLSLVSSSRIGIGSKKTSCGEFLLAKEIDHRCAFACLLPRQNPAPCCTPQSVASCLGPAVSTMLLLHMACNAPGSCTWRGASGKLVGLSTSAVFKTLLPSLNSSAPGLCIIAVPQGLLPEHPTCFHTICFLLVRMGEKTPGLGISPKGTLSSHPTTTRCHFSLVLVSCAAGHGWTRRKSSAEMNDLELQKALRPQRGLCYMSQEGGTVSCHWERNAEGFTQCLSSPSKR